MIEYKQQENCIFRPTRLGCHLLFWLIFFLDYFTYTEQTLAQGANCNTLTNRAILIELARLNAEEIKELDGVTTAYRFANNDNLIWNLNEKISSWPGVSVHESDPNIVKGLYLSNFDLTSVFPENLGCLTGLDTLNLSRNSLGGVLPNSIVQLTSLSYLNLSNNQLTGSIPYLLFANLTSLAHLDLSNNWQKDTEPNSGFTGEIPRTINSNQLQVLRLSNNRMEGILPNILGNIPSLKILDLGDSKGTEATEGNRFNSLPKPLSLPQLEEIYINNNDLTGTIPIGLWQSPNLRVIDLSENKLTGSLPNKLANLPRLNIMFLQKNQLSGNIPSLGSTVTFLTDINLSENFFTGSIPSSFSQLQVATKLLLNKNNISDISELDLSLLTFLEELNLAENNIDFLPNAWQLPTSLDFAQIQSNELTFEDLLPNLSTLITNTVSYLPQDSVGITKFSNAIVGETVLLDFIVDENLPEGQLAEYTWYKDGEIITITDNTKSELLIENVQPNDAGVYSFTSTHPTFPGLLLYSRKITLRVTDNCSEVGYNDLKIIYDNTDGVNWNWLDPSKAWDFTQVGTFNMTNWEGVELNEQGCVVGLSLINKGLNGLFPTEVGGLLELRTLNISENNELRGKIPESIGSLAFLDTLILGENSLNEEIPDAIGQLTNLKYLDLRANQLIAPIPKSLFNLSNLESINLSTNQFNGEITQEFASLINLKELNLRNNNFIGSLPNGISDLPLEQLLVNNNQLEGLGNLTNINETAFVNVASNALTFEDILDYVPNLDTYAPQDSIGEAQVQVLIPGEDYVFDLGIDETVTTNNYMWKKDGNIIDINNNNSFSILNANLDDLGEYTCEVTNQGADLLMLFSRSFILTNQVPGTGNNSLSIIGDTLVCISSSLNSYEVINSSDNVTWSLDADAGDIFSLNETQTDILWKSIGTFDLTIIDNDSQERSTITVRVTDIYPTPKVEFDPIIVINQPFKDVNALGVENAEFIWTFNGEVVETGSVFNPGNVNSNGFSNTDAGFYNFELRQQASQATCQSNPAPFTIRIVLENLPNPTGLTATNQGNNTVELQWNFSEPELADSLVIERSITDTDGFETIAIIPYDGINEYFDNIILEEGIVYYYRIRVADFENDLVSPYSNIAAVTTNGSVNLNTPPSIANINKIGQENESLAFTANDFIQFFTDNDNDSLISITIKSLPENGVLILNDEPVTIEQVINKEQLETLVFEPNTDWFGETQYTFTANDGSDDSTIATVFIRIEEEVVTLAPPDLSITANTIITTVKPGDQINFDFAILNEGESSAGNFLFSIFLSNDNQLSTDDIPLISSNIEEIGAGARNESTQLLIIPPDFALGTYYVIFVVDNNNAIEESNEENNITILEIVVEEELLVPEIPNIITPNGDLINDFLEINNLEQYPENTLIILNKWGIEVYNTNGYQNNWNGIDSNGTPLPAGNYIVILNVQGEFPVEYTEVLTIAK